MEAEKHLWDYIHFGNPRKRIYIFGEAALEDPANNNVLIIDTVADKNHVFRRIEVFEEQLSEQKLLDIKSGKYHNHRGGPLLPEG
jgi:hypothetical protein